MHKVFIDRTLWREAGGNVIRMHQTDLLMRREPMVILGEAGMGKSQLLDWIATHSGYVRCTARQLVNRFDPRTLVDEGHVLVIDALDEVRAQKDGDAVDQVLRKLGAAGYPSFVMSCRLADWRSATGLEAIREQYTEVPLELHLDPFDEDDAFKFLAACLGPDDARTVIEHFKSRDLVGLLGNPQTLQMIAEVAESGPLPANQFELFNRATDLLRVEHQDSKAEIQVGREIALNAAGAAFAALILTGSEAIVRTSVVDRDEAEIPIAEIAALPAAEALPAVMGTRLFRSMGADKFGYLHRRIGEFVGAHWLANLANTPRKQKRLLAMFQSRGLVPASLRGLHAWLANYGHLANAVVNADPLGVLEYGDADALTVQQSKVLIESLERLATENPYFGSRGSYSARGIAKTQLAELIGKKITDPLKPYGLRYLLLEMLAGSAAAALLTVELLAIFNDSSSAYALRYAAGEALIASKKIDDWHQAVVLLQQNDDSDSVRLAIELSDEIGYEFYSDDQIVALVVADCQKDGHTIGVTYRLERNLPVARLEGVLTRLSEVASGLGKPGEREGDYELTDFALALIVRRLRSGSVSGQQLWAWLRPLDPSYGYRQELREQLNKFIQNDDALRRSIQQLVLLDEESEIPIRAKAWSLTERSSALGVNASDLICLLGALDPGDHHDQRWRELIELIRHGSESGADVRAAARPFASHNQDLLEWIDRLEDPVIHDWEVRRERETRKREAQRATELAESRAHYQKNINRMRAGSFKDLIYPAKAYLKLVLFGDMDPRPQERVQNWLGQELAAAAFQGFEAFLTAEELNPTSHQVTSALVEGKSWDSGLIIIAALAERLRASVGFDDLADERLLVGLFELWQRSIAEHAGIKGLGEVIELQIRRRGIWEDAVRLFFEPQLEANCERIHNLYGFMRDETDATLASKLALEWLARYPKLSLRVEQELADHLRRHGQHEPLRILAASRQPDEEQARLYWTAVSLILDFDRVATELSQGPIPPDLIWQIRHCIGGRHNNSQDLDLSPATIEWIVRNFRELWPAVESPVGGLIGDVNYWNATDFLSRLIHRLGGDSSLDASAALQRLRAGVPDGYTATIQVAASEQMRIRVESAFVAPTIASIAAVLRDDPPVTTEDLQAVVVDELALVQAKVRSDDAESWRGFYDRQGVALSEEDCRDHLLGLLRQGGVGIYYEPESHLAADKEADITCAVGPLRLPIEIKGQWHSDLWSGCDSQLDRLYATDWRAEGRGIYLVLWFGKQPPNKSLTSAGRDRIRPSNPEELLVALTARSKAAQDGRIMIFVLDLERG